MTLVTHNTCEMYFYAFRGFKYVFNVHTDSICEQQAAIRTAAMTGKSISHLPYYYKKKVYVPRK